MPQWVNGVKRRYIDGPFGQIHIAESTEHDVRSEVPSILLLHQTPRSIDEYREVMSSLAGKYHLFAMDLPGMGASDPAPSATIEDYALAANRIVDALSPSKQVIVCGHHTGGVVAIELAASRPEKIHSLILSSTPWIDAAVREERAVKDPIDTILPECSGSHLLSLWQQRKPYYPNSVHMLNRFISDALRATSPTEGHHAVSQYRMEDRAPLVQAPVLVVEHSQDPFSSKHTIAIAERFDGSQLEKIEDGMVPLDHTGLKFSKLIDRWIAEIPSKSP